MRWEYRNEKDVGPGSWVQADAGYVYAAHQRDLVVRALFETPRVVQPEKVHDFQRHVCAAGKARTGPGRIASRPTRRSTHSPGYPWNRAGSLNR
ncbi:hypothetical protein BN1263280089 [Stenotrophomonas maltophilia]|nr:hypothetical protein BN1263280089 [Stenotrophomonas maltophilia]